MLDFYIPKLKSELVKFMSINYPLDSNGKKINWNEYNKKQLSKIYIKYRRKNG
jgi:hypothetical protein